MIEVVRIDRVDECSGAAILTIADENHKMDVFCWETPHRLAVGDALAVSLYPLNSVVVLVSDEDRQEGGRLTQSVIAKYDKVGVFRVGEIPIYIGSGFVPGDIEVGAVVLVSADRFDAVIECESTGISRSA